ncbi:diguanylate cyclase domain-containing protein [Egicoccus sp. AB-alg6-2]|uniref:GGDEF domain-containing protein n=1 Tax=Egicoccus sp. AB-alg6-2 TaxID=3242692 RepID=UPI00359DDF15
MLVGAVLARTGPHRVPHWHLLGVLVATVVVSAFPLVLGSGRARAAYVLDGTVFVMAVLVLPGPEAFLTLTLPAALYELVTARRDVDRRWYFAAGTALSNAAVVGLFHAVAGFLDATPLLVAVAIICAYLGIGLYHAGLLVLLGLHGAAPPVGSQLVRFLFPAAGVYGVSTLVGALLSIIGRRGAAPFGLALATAIAFHLLYWEYRNMAAARMRTDRLFDLAAELPNLVTADTIERNARSAAADLLLCDDVAIEDEPPASLQTTAAMTVRGRTRWLVPTSALSNLRGAADDEQRALQAVARVAASALERLELEAELRAESQRDPLTGVLNRAAFDRELRTAIARARRNGRGFAIAYGDLDGFKPINDEYGHQVGDEVLRHVADRLRSELREGDVVARIGGDEFVLLLHPPAGALDVEAAVDRASRAVARPMRIPDAAGGNPDVEVSVGISLGAAAWPTDGETPQELIRAADRRMYEVKRATH